MTVEISWRRGRHLLVAVLAGAAGTVGAVAAVDPPISAGALIVGLLCAAFFWVPAVFLFRRAVSKRPAIIFSREGIFDPTGTFRVGRAGWEVVDSVDTGTVVKTRLLPFITLHTLNIKFNSTEIPVRPRSRAIRVLRGLMLGNAQNSIGLALLAARYPDGLRDSVRDLAPGRVSVS